MKKTYEQMLNELHERQIVILNQRIQELEQLELNTRFKMLNKLFKEMKNQLQIELLKLYSIM